MPYWVYMLASGQHGTLYTGVTNDLARRNADHKDGRGSGFGVRHAVTRLVWYEEFADVREAIAHEKRLKRWRRDWKLSLIEGMNPFWEDLHPP